MVKGAKNDLQSGQMQDKDSKVEYYPIKMRRANLYDENMQWEWLKIYKFPKLK